MSRKDLHKFRLYVSGDSRNSAAAIANLTGLCREHLPDCHEIEIVDVAAEPMRALREGIIMTPTLIKLAPPPVVRMVGALSEPVSLMRALALEPEDVAIAAPTERSERPALTLLHSPRALRS